MRKKISITLYADFDETDVLSLDEDLTDHLIEKYPGNDSGWDIPGGDIAISSTPDSLDITGIISDVTSDQLCEAIDALLVIPKHWSSHSVMMSNEFHLGDLLPGYYHIAFSAYYDNYWVVITNDFIRIWKDRTTAPDNNQEPDFVGTREQAAELDELIISLFGRVEIYRYQSE